MNTNRLLQILVMLGLAGVLAACQPNAGNGQQPETSAESAPAATMNEGGLQITDLQVGDGALPVFVRPRSRTGKSSSVT